MGRSLKTVIAKIENDVVIRQDIDDAEQFSTIKKCATVSIDVHDDDFLIYTLYLNGENVDFYNSCPGFFDDSGTEPTGGDASILAQAFGCPQATKQIDEILRFDSLDDENDDDRYIFATDRLKDLIEALGGNPNNLDDQNTAG